MSAAASRGKVRRGLRTLHRATGLLLGGVFVVAGLSGSALVYRDALAPWLGEGPPRAAAASGPMALDAAAQAARRALAEERAPRFVRLPQAPGEPLAFWTGEPHRIVYVDPQRAAVLGMRDEHGGVLGTLHALHVELFAGETGLRVVGVLGLLLLGTTLSGVVVARPSRRRPGRRLRLRLRGSGLRAAFDLHRSVGLVAAPLLLLSALTGVMLAFHRETRLVLVALLGGPALAMPGPVEPLPERPALAPSALLARGAAALPEAQPTWLAFGSAASGEPAVVRLRFPENPHPNGTSYVALHPQTGDVRALHSYREAGAGVWLGDWKYPLHIGEVLGPVGRAATFLGGLAPAVLYASGLVFWVKRRRRRRARVSARPRPTAGAGLSAEASSSAAARLASEPKEPVHG